MTVLLNFPLLKEKRDTIGNLVVEDYWNWKEKILKERSLYDSKKGYKIKLEQWWQNGNKRTEWDNLKNVTKRWNANGKMESFLSSTQFISFDRNGKLLKKVKLKSDTE